MFEIRLSAAGQRAVNELFRFFETIALRVDAGMQDELQAAVLQGFQDNFDQQSSPLGAWSQLAPSTQRDRQLKGFPPAAPILIRTGSYKDALTEAQHPQHYHQVRHSGRIFVMEEGSNDNRLPFLEGGTTQSPARPATIIGNRGEDAIGSAFDRIMHQISTRAGM